MHLSSGLDIPDGLLAANALLAENSRLGVPASTHTLHTGFGFVISNTALGLRRSLYDDGVGSRCTGKERDAESGLDYFGARYLSSNMGRFMSPDDGSDQSAGDPQSWNLYSYVRNNPLSNVDPDGHDCIDTANLAKTGTVTVWEGTSCAYRLGKDELYINGTVDKNSLTTDGKGNLGYSFTSYDGQDGGGGVISRADPYGPLDGPANRAGLNQLANSAGVVSAVASAEFDAAGIFFPITHLAISIASGRYTPGVNLAGIARKPGTLGQFGSTKAENKIAADIVKKTGADREVVHELLQEGSQDAGRALSFREGLAYVRAALGLIE